MKYLIWRHENALGNSAEQTVGLAKFIVKNNDLEPIIYVENDFQKYFAYCLPNVKPENVHFLNSELCDLSNINSILNTPEYQDLYSPSVYGNPHGLIYPGTWAELSDDPDITLNFPHKTYENKFNLPKDAIVIQIRESGTFWKRVDGANCEPNRFINPHTFFEVAKYFADKGYKVVRIGDYNQTSMPVHENIMDFAKYENRTMLDDLFLINHAKVFLSCDSGIWPMAGGFRSNLILSNVVSVFNSSPPKYEIVSWLPQETSIVLYKKDRIHDNSFDELINSIEKFL